MSLETDAGPIQMSDGSWGMILLTNGIGKFDWPAFAKLDGDWDYPGRPDTFPNPNATGLPLQFIPHWSFP